MKRHVSLPGILALALCVFSARAADPSPFLNFQGNFSKHGHVTVLENGARTASGKIRQSFHIGATGESARLKISGQLTLNGAVHPFTAVYVFKKKNPDGIYVAAASNLAPGLDDGFAAEAGTYALRPSQIIANLPFTFGTTAGKAALRITLKKRPQGTRLTVTHTLSINTLSSPITWKFEGLSRH